MQEKETRTMWMGKLQFNIMLEYLAHQAANMETDIKMSSFKY